MACVLCVVCVCVGWSDGRVVYGFAAAAHWQSLIDDFVANATQTFAARKLNIQLVLDGGYA